MSFGGDYGKVTGDYVNAAKDAIATMVAALTEITIKDEENEFASKECQKKGWNPQIRVKKFEN